jgi:hypothetical protein
VIPLAQDTVKEQYLYFLNFSNLKGISHEMDLAFDDMYGLDQIGDAASF